MVPPPNQAGYWGVAHTAVGVAVSKVDSPASAQLAR